MRKKHSSKNKKSQKYTLIFFVLLILICIILFIKNFKTNNIIIESEGSNTVNNQEIKQDKFVLSSKSTVINSNNLNSDGVNISSASNNTYILSSTIENISETQQEKCNLTVVLYDSSENELCRFSFSTSSLKPDGKVNLYTVSTENLSTAYYYSVILT